MNTIGLYGGSFNPPHFGHLILAETAREQCGLDTVFFIPSDIPPHKQQHHLAPARDRLAMVERAVAGNAGFQSSDIEIRKGGTSYTIQTVNEFERRFPGGSLNLIIGIDNLIDFRSWRDNEELLTKASLLVFDRPGFRREDVPRDLLRFVKFITAPLLGISSSDVRLRIKGGKSIQYYVPDRVAEYIRVHRLYQ